MDMNNNNIGSVDIAAQKKDRFNRKFSAIINSLMMVRFNLKIIFGNRFIYFLVSAIVLAFFIIGINLFNGEMISEKGIYGILVLTGSLLLFYPAAFSIQSDKDARTLEIIFGIPDYRFRVWFMRLMLIYTIVFIVLLLLSSLFKYVFVQYPIMQMNIQVMYPLAFLGLMAFFLSTVLRSGNATAAVMIILGVLLLILGENMEQSFWNIFLNPYNAPTGTNDLVWQILMTKNRIFLASGSVVFLLGGLMNLQNREKLLG
jgi:hypothetical protein